MNIKKLFLENRYSMVDVIVISIIFGLFNRFIDYLLK